MNNNEYRTNASGHLVPVSKIPQIDLLRDDTVTRIINMGNNTQAALKAFKLQAMVDITAFLNIAAETYDVKYGGRRGNLSLMSFDGKYKVQLAVADTQSFDERLHIAKQLVDECIHEWSKDSNDNIKALVEHAFQTDRQGNLNTARIFGLMRLDIKDDKWTRAMEVLKASIQVTNTSEYLRLYERDDSETGMGKYRQISIDLAGV